MPKHRRVSLTRRLRRCQPGTGMRKIERANGVTHDDTTDRRRHESAATGNGRTDDNERQLTRLSGVDRQPQILSTVIRARRSRVNEPGLWRAGREGARIFTTIIMVALRRRRRGSNATLRAGRKDIPVIQCVVHVPCAPLCRDGWRACYTEDITGSTGRRNTQILRESCCAQLGLFNMKHSGMRPFMAREAIPTRRRSWMVSERVKNGEERAAALPVNWLQTFKRHACGSRAQ